jgi:Fe2+ or Zn2+ uptake regulation protein
MHLACNHCGAVEEIDDLSVGESLRRALAERYGFESDLTHLAIAGRCRQCRGEAPHIAPDEPATGPARHRAAR